MNEESVNKDVLDLLGAAGASEAELASLKPRLVHIAADRVLARVLAELPPEAQGAFFKLINASPSREEKEVFLKTHLSGRMDDIVLEEIAALKGELAAAGDMLAGK